MRNFASLKKNKMRLVEVVRNTQSLQNDGVAVGDVFETIPVEGVYSAFLLVRKIKGAMDLPYKKGTRWIDKTMACEINENES